MNERSNDLALLRFTELLKDIEYPGMQILCGQLDYVHHLLPIAGAPVYLMVTSQDVCNVTGEPLEWKSRKWLLSRHMTDGEVIQTALKAIMTAEEHEIRERFKYKGQPVFDPHYDIDKLVELRASADALKEREDNREVAA